MTKKISDIEYVTVKDSCKDSSDQIVYNIEARFKDGQKFSIAEFDQDCEDICIEVAELINTKIEEK